MERLSPPTSIPENPAFVSFDDEDAWSVPGYRRNLPHWRAEGVTYFVTFRLADSIPISVMLRWREDREHWLRAHGIEPAWEIEAPERYQGACIAVPKGELRNFEREQARRYFVELDRCHGACLLREAAARQVVGGALRHFHGQRVWLGDFVLMPNHVHLIVQPFPGVKLEEWLYSVKRFSGMRLGPADGQVWQEESFDRVMRDLGELARTREYIVRNPAKLRPSEFTLELAAWLDAFAL